MASRLQQQTIDEWRALGFFYDRNEGLKEWRITGSRKGMSRFAGLLRAYAADPRNAVESEHEHYGPYSYLKVMTSRSPGSEYSLAFELREDEFDPASADLVEG